MPSKGGSHTGRRPYIALGSLCEVNRTAAPPKLQSIMVHMQITKQAHAISRLKPDQDWLQT